MAVLLVLGGVACRARNQDQHEDLQRSELSATAAPHLSTSVAPSRSIPQVQTEASLEAISAEDLFRLIRNGASCGTVVNVWATWCAPCRRELPTLKAETERLAADGIGLLIVSVDDEKDQSKIPVVLSKYGIGAPYYVVRPPKGAFKRAVHPKWSGGLPVSFLFERRGKGRFFWDAPVTTKVLRSILEEFVAEQTTKGKACRKLNPGYDHR